MWTFVHSGAERQTLHGEAEQRKTLQGEALQGKTLRGEPGGCAGTVREFHIFHMFRAYVHMHQIGASNLQSRSHMRNSLTKALETCHHIQAAQAQAVKTGLYCGALYIVCDV